MAPSGHPEPLQRCRSSDQRTTGARIQEVIVERLRRRGGNDRGTAALELAFILPIFLLIVYGGLSFGLAMAAKGSITQAAAEGARSAIGASVIPADNGSQCAAYTRTAQTQAVQALKGLGAAATY